MHSCILHSHCKVLILSKKRQANPVGLHSVLRGWRFTPGCFGGWRCCLGALWPRTKTLKSWRRFWNECWTVERFLFDYWTCYCGISIMRLFTTFYCGYLSPPPSPQTQGVLVVEISFQIRVWFNKNPLKWTTDFYPCLSRWQRCNGRWGEAWMFKNSCGEFFQVSSGVD